MTDLIITSAQAGAQFLNSDLGRMALDLAFQDSSSNIKEGRRLSDVPVLRSREGAAIPRVFGRMRLGGQLLWASELREQAHESGGGKGGPSAPRQRHYSYRLDFAIALCEGLISSIGRIWVDGVAQDLSAFHHRLYKGSETQNPNPKMKHHLGASQTPAYRGLAYIVFEDFDITAFGNRIPQFNFEVFTQTEDTGSRVKAVSVIPGATEFGYDPEIVIQVLGKGRAQVENTRLSADKSDWELSINDLQESCPDCQWVSLVVSWFGDDLRADHISIEPRIVSKIKKTAPKIWRVAGRDRRNAKAVSQYDGRPAFDGTPNDASVIAAIKDLKQRGFKVMFYPFVMMDIPKDNDLPSLENPSQSQPAYAWRGHIGLARAQHKTSAVNTALKRFFYGQGTQANPKAGLAFMIEHYAKLCRQAGGVDAFLLGSEFKQLSQLQDAHQQFPFATHLVSLAKKVRAQLPTTKISYAADWSEYGAVYDAVDDDVNFPLDVFWADKNTDFIGVDNYLPIADWRDGGQHLDAQAGYGDIYEPAYLQSQIEGGAFYDWYYANDAARATQTRSLIQDPQGEPFIYRQKDFRGWWENDHHPRRKGVRQPKTAWRAKSKPIWFTELGCPAVDKGANEPNRFPDVKSSDGGLPFASNGQRDDAMQRAYIAAWQDYWNKPTHNPQAELYDGKMIDTSKFFIWAWDARPFPAFPMARDIWVDGASWAKGHWLNGRLSSVLLGQLISQISDKLSGSIANIGQLEGYLANGLQTPRELLEPLMQAFSLDAVMQGEQLVLTGRHHRSVTPITARDHVVTPQYPQPQETRLESHHLPQALKLGFLSAEGAYETSVVEAWRDDHMAPEAYGGVPHIAQIELPIVLSQGQAQQIAERLLAEIWVARDKLRLNLSNQFLHMQAGDFIAYENKHYRITRLQDTGMREIEAERVSLDLYANRQGDEVAQSAPLRFSANRQVTPIADVHLLELTNYSQQEKPTLYAAAFADPWHHGIQMQHPHERWQLKLARPAVLGVTQTVLKKGVVGRWDKSQTLTLQVEKGGLVSQSIDKVLSGGNRMAIKNALGWEIIQFQKAELIAPQIYQLSHLLRGQFGSDGVMAAQVPAGADCVLLDEAVQPLPLSLNDMSEELVVHAGPVERMPTDYSWQILRHHVQRIAARPLAPVHIHLSRMTGGCQIKWIRRNQIGGDDWQAPDIPLDGVLNLYELRFYAGTDKSKPVRVQRVQGTAYFYADAHYKTDHRRGSLTLEIAQIGAQQELGFAARFALSDFMRSL